MGFWSLAWSLAWDVRNFAWSDAASFELLGAVSDANELLRYLSELGRVESDAQTVEWVGRNYRTTLRVSMSLLQRLLNFFGQSGLLREVETVQKEVVERDLLRDCLERGSNDLKGLVQIFKYIALQYSCSDRSEDL
ncbi:Transposase for transposon Tn4430 like [Actinidia chinensis var. chinensis]|uniref:Transposase for transposon Tn4430 like n=1 Tax=Actinidia chinensis var. chinensis TaxID=1590841 RepID=A0A2R6PY29_ACTCC|nr:Transposase for transposon Tn4430 like [Actinidia chinensis var. chinensis]